MWRKRTSPSCVLQVRVPRCQHCTPRVPPSSYRCSSSIAHLHLQQIYNLVAMSASITNHECTLRHYSKQSEVMSLHDKSNKTPAERWDTDRPWLLFNTSNWIMIRSLDNLWIGVLDTRRMMYKSYALLRLCRVIAVFELSRRSGLDVSLFADKDFYIRKIDLIPALS